MKLASLKEDGRDGRLIVVSRDLARGLRVHDIAPTLQHALDDWAFVEPKLRAASGWLNRGPVAGAFEFDPSHCAAPLPRGPPRCSGCMSGSPPGMETTGAPHSSTARKHSSGVSWRLSTCAGY